jgi:hypothetical protein
MRWKRIGITFLHHRDNILAYTREKVLRLCEALRQRNTTSPYPQPFPPKGEREHEKSLSHRGRDLGRGRFDKKIFQSRSCEANQLRSYFLH